MLPVNGRLSGVENPHLAHPPPGGGGAGVPPYMCYTGRERGGGYGFPGGFRSLGGV